MDRPGSLREELICSVYMVLFFMCAKEVYRSLAVDRIEIRGQPIARPGTMIVLRCCVEWRIE